MGLEYHKGMSVPYQATGRVQQKTRTRTALVTAARSLIASGATPTVEQAATEAQVSRTTAYRYFPTQKALLLEAYPEVGQESVLGADPPEDVQARFDIVFAEMARQVTDNEAPLRAMLRISLEDAPPPDRPLLRRGRRRVWIADALEPLRSRIGSDDFDRLVLCIAASTGIESFIWLKDIAGLQAEQAVDVMRSTAQTLLDAAR